MPLHHPLAAECPLIDPAVDLRAALPLASALADGREGSLLG
jgi:hypothetical protein